MYKLLIPFIALYLYTGKLLAQQQDSLLIKQVLEVITTHQDIAPYVMRITLGDIVKGDYTNRRAARFATTYKDSASTRPVLFIKRDNSYWSSILQQMGMRGSGFYHQQDFDLYFLHYGNLMLVEVPFLLEIKASEFSNNKYTLQISSRKAPWSHVAFSLKNPPSDYYTFTIIFKKKKGDWQLHSVNRKTNS